MVHFRYHLTTLAAVFLSLGIGILLGGTAGRHWFDDTQQAIFVRMEEKYDQALKQNIALREQIRQLSSQAEQNSHEVLHLMAVRYADILQGQEIAVWFADHKKFNHAKQVLDSLGMKTRAYDTRGYKSELPLLILADELPDWAHALPDQAKWTLVSDIPHSPAKQWELIEKIQGMIEEKRREDEKS